MKICKVKLTIIADKSLNNYHMPLPSFITGGSYVMLVYTDDGLVGLGEYSPYGGTTVEMFKAFRSDYFTDMLKINPRKEAPFTSNISSMTIIDSSALNALFAGLTQEVWDIRGKADNKPVYKLINAKAEPNVEAYASGGMWYDDTSPETIINEAKNVWLRVIKAISCGHRHLVMQEVISNETLIRHPWIFEN